MLVDFLVWLDDSPWRYWTVCGVFGLLVAALVAAPSVSRLIENRRWRWLGHDAAFFAALAMMLLAFRWPVFLFHRQLNPDESGYISQALTLRHDPVFWRSITSGTSGPINTYPRLLPALLGLPLNFMTSRFMALGLALGFLIVFYFTCHCFASVTFSRLSVLAPATFLALTTNGDFTHHSGEHLPVLLLALAAFVALRLTDSVRKTSAMAYAAGWLLGAVPFAKLQGGVLAMTTAIFCGVYLLLRNESLMTRLKRCGFLILGGVTVPALVVAQAWFSGCFEHFRESYIAMNLGYMAGGKSWGEFIAGLPGFRPDMPEFFAYFLGLILAGLLGWTAIFIRGRWGGMSGASRRLLMFTSVMLPVSIFTALAPGRPFAHYSLFVVLPAASWAFASFNGAFGDANDQAGSPEMRQLSYAAWCAITVAGQCGDYLLSRQPLELRGKVATYVNAPLSPVAHAILRHCSPGQPLCVWGWMNEFHVETGTWRATSDLLLEYLWNAEPGKSSMMGWRDLIPDYFQNLYVEDLMRSNPPVFVDAVAPSSFIFTDREMFGHETFPKLTDYVAANYELTHEIGGIRIYVRNDVVRSSEGSSPAGNAGASSIEVLDRSRREGNAEYSLGSSFLGNGRLDEAAEHFQKAVELRPDFALARQQLGLIYLKRGMIEDALTHFRREVQLIPDDGSARARLAEALLRGGWVEEAVNQYNSALKIDPDRANSLNNLAWILAVRGDALVRDGARAVELASRAARLTGNKNAAILNTLAASYGEAGRFSEALESSQQALDIATAAKDGALAEIIRSARDCYVHGQPFRTPVLAYLPE
jgi:Flp pilus assembly protein TadD